MNSMKNALLFCTLVSLLIVGCGAINGQAASDNLLRVNSKDAGWSHLDITISEVERGERTSLLTLTQVSDDSGTEGRFLFCFVYRLVQIRGLRYAFWSKPNAEDKTSLVVFPESEQETIEDIIGEKFYDYSFYDHIMDSEGREWKKLHEHCGF